MIMFASFARRPSKHSSALTSTQSALNQQPMVVGSWSAIIVIDDDDDDDDDDDER